MPQTEFAFVLMAVVFIIAPPALAVLADHEARAFQREAFGHLRKAARNLRILIWVVMGFYLGVICGDIATGRILELFQSPLTGSAILTYVRLGGVVAGYGVLHTVARELFLVTQPGAPPPGAPRE